MERDEKRKQIRTYVEPKERDDFRDYAGSIGLDQSTLLVLLMLRATRFGSDQWAQVKDAAERVQTGKAKITAHVSENLLPQVEKIEKLCPHDLGRPRICGALVRLELEEGWLTGQVLGNDSI